MKKVFVMPLIICLCGFILMGCTTSDLKEKGTAFVESIFAEDYATVEAEMSSYMKDNMPEDSMIDMVTTLQDSFGEFDSVVSVTVGSNADFPDYSVAKVKVQCADGIIAIELAYDDNQKVAGINILTPENMESQEDQAPAPIVEDGTQNANPAGE